MCGLQEFRFKSKDTERLKVKGRRKKLCANSNKRRAWVAILISDKINFKPKSILRDTQEKYILIKRPSHHEGMSVLSMCAPNNEVIKYIRQTWTEVKGEIVPQ